MLRAAANVNDVCDVRVASAERGASCRHDLAPVTAKAWLQAVTVLNLKTVLDRAIEQQCELHRPNEKCDALIESMAHVMSALGVLRAGGMDGKQIITTLLPFLSDVVCPENDAEPGGVDLATMLNGKKRGQAH